MDTQKPDIKNNWDRWSKIVKREYPQLTDEDLMYEINKDEELLLRLQEKTGKTRKQIFDWLKFLG
jgi:hypothetical protein